MKSPLMVLLLSLVLLASCAEKDLPEYILLGDLRILAMKADTPEVSAGAVPVTLTPVVSDLNGAGRALSYTAESCIDPGVGLGASPSCADRPDRLSLGSGTITLSAPFYTGSAPTVSVPVPPTAVIFALRSAADQLNGIAYLVSYTLTATDSAGATTSVTAFKRIIVSTRTTKNTNPSLLEINAGAQTLLAYLSTLQYPGAGGTTTEVILTPTLGATSTESYDSKVEVLTTTWFLSNGAIKRFRTLGTDPNYWTPPVERPASHGMLFVTVTRDGRGGENFRQTEF